MNLKLAEYKDGKFERFLFRSKSNISDFLIRSNDIQIAYCNDNSDIYVDEYKLDQKDPLNRFNGLFDGRTYGGGRFVLVRYVNEISEDDICDLTQSDIQKEIYSEWILGIQNVFLSKFQLYFNPCNILINYHKDSKYKHLFTILGNLHENPELYEKLICKNA